MPFLIDGYNLMFAVGFLYTQAGEHRLQKARDELLAWLAHAHGATASEVTVVFDARRPAPKRAAEQTFAGLQVRFASSGSADDLIEDLIRSEPAPERLTVVSSDHRLLQAARRRSCPAWDCPRYLDWLERQARPPAERPPPPGKPTGVSPEEADEWLRAFDLDGQPDAKELFEPFDFDDRP